MKGNRSTLDPLVNDTDTSHDLRLLAGDLAALAGNRVGPPGLNHVLTNSGPGNLKATRGEPLVLVHPSDRLFRIVGT